MQANVALTICGFRRHYLFTVACGAVYAQAHVTLSIYVRMQCYSQSHVVMSICGRVRCCPQSHVALSIYSYVWHCPQSHVAVYLQLRMVLSTVTVALPIYSYVWRCPCIIKCCSVFSWSDVMVSIYGRMQHVYTLSWMNRAGRWIVYRNNG